MLSKLNTYLRLGVHNLMRAVIYRLSVRLGVHPVLKLSSSVSSPPFYRKAELEIPSLPTNIAWDDHTVHFGWKQEALNGEDPPNWFANPFSDCDPIDSDKDWWNISDFGHGDIKGTWELSRFDWVVAYATDVAQGNFDKLARLNNWLTDWADANPPYRGPNWKCGQEASIRVMHLMLAALLMGQAGNMERGLRSLLSTHLKRIAPTTSYAMAQQNNHASSEAAALFVGGAALHGYEQSAEKWMQKGRRLLENRARVLISKDGSFSQHSVVYHRLMLDTYSLAEVCRRKFGLPKFSDRLYERLSTATRWLETMVDAKSGDAPNLGANDGAKLLPINHESYREFRTSVELAANLFDSRSAYGEGPWQKPLVWLNLEQFNHKPRCVSESFLDGGYHVLQTSATKVVLRFPVFKFRPGQADALHLDLFHKGENILRDAGTFSYNSDQSYWFSGTSAHNTVTFDERDQMPRLGRFLFSNWLKSSHIEAISSTGDTITAKAGYSDYKNCRHIRRVALNEHGLSCVDQVSGGFNSATLRWRLLPSEWIQDGMSFVASGIKISIEADTEIIANLRETLESQYYFYKRVIPEIQIFIDKPSTITTRIDFL